MADRYWIGGTGNTNDTNEWSSSSGGAGGASVPGASDNAYFDANSFSGTGQTVTVNAALSVKDFIWTGALYNPTLAGASALGINGDVVLISGMTVSHTADWQFATAATHLVTTNGVSLASLPTFGSSGAINVSVSFQDNFSAVGTTLYWRGAGSTISTNDYTITCGTFQENAGGGAVTFTFGASVINCTAFTAIANTVISTSTSSIRVTGTGTFAGAGKTYNEVQLNGTSHTITGSNTFSTLIVGTAGSTISFTDGTTQTVTTFRAVGTAASKITLQGTAAAGWTLSMAGGVTNTNAISISRSTGSGGGRFIAVESTDGGNNTDWQFTPAFLKKKLYGNSQTFMVYT